jgi:nucleotide-binding universal stress UspA family protein
MKTILLLTDFSNGSNNAIRYAIQFYKEYDCLFHVLYVHKTDTFTSDDLMLASGSSSIYDSIVKVPKERLETYISELQNEFKNSTHSFEAHIDFDGFNQAVSQAVKTNNIDLIVLGSNGATGAKEVIFGSNTLNVIRHANVSTLVIPEGYNYRKCEEILLPLDPEDGLNGDPFNRIIDFIEIHNMHLHVLRINPDNENPEIMKSDKSNLSIINCQYNYIHGVPMHHAVDSYLQTNNIDFIGLIVQKEGFFRRLFFGSTTTQISQTAKRPLLIVHS